MKIYRDTWWFECKWVVIDFVEADSCLIPRCLSLQGSVVLRWDKNAALTFEAAVLAAPVKSAWALHKLNLVCLVPFPALGTHLSATTRRFLRFVFLLCCFRKGCDLTSPERQTSQLVSVTCCAVLTATAQYITQCHPSALHPHNITIRGSVLR